MLNLPKSTEINKILPKSSFDKFTNTKQKKAFSEKILRITWLNKISLDTVNLKEGEIKEIQVFKIELKDKTFIKDLLLFIDKVIPYHIIFYVYFKDEFYISTSVKHIHPQNEDMSVIDHTFSTEWMDSSQRKYFIELKNHLDWVYKRFCEQLSTLRFPFSKIKDLVNSQKEYQAILKEIEVLKSKIARCTI